MLKGISPYLSPDLLKTLAEMGHGDEIILADAHLPGHTYDNHMGLEPDRAGCFWWSCPYQRIIRGGILQWLAQ